MPRRVFYNGLHEVAPVLKLVLEYFTKTPNAVALPISGALAPGGVSSGWYDDQVQRFKKKGIDLPNASELRFHCYAPDGSNDKWNPSRIMRGKRAKDSNAIIDHQHILWGEWVLPCVTSDDELTCWAYEAINSEGKLKTLAHHINVTLNYYGPARVILREILKKNCSVLFDRMAAIHARKVHKHRVSTKHSDSIDPPATNWSQDVPLPVSMSSKKHKSTITEMKMLMEQGDDQKMPEATVSTTSCNKRKPIDPPGTKWSQDVHLPVCSSTKKRKDPVESSLNMESPAEKDN